MLAAIGVVGAGAVGFVRPRVTDTAGVAHHRHHHVAGARRRHRRLEAGPGGIPNRAARRVAHRDPGHRRPCPDAVQDGHHLLAPVGGRLVADLRPVVVGVWPDHGDRADAGGQRQGAMVVLEQHDALPRRLQRHREVLGAARHPLRPLRIDVGILEQSEQEFQPQYAAHRPVDVLLSDQSALQRLRQALAVPPVARRMVDHAHVGQVLVEPGAQRRCRRLRCVGRHPLRDQVAHRTGVADDNALEAPLVAQQLGQVVGAGRRRIAVIFGTFRHHPLRTLLDRLSPRPQHHLLHLALPYPHAGKVVPALRVAHAGVGA